MACCNAEGQFLPPVLILKGVNKKQELGDVLPQGSEVYKNPKSSYINSLLFLRWLLEHLFREPSGKCLLILDVHYSASELLDLVDSHDITIPCLPSHTTQALQPLDRSLFKPLKIYYNQEAIIWTGNHKGRNITRYQVGQLIGKACGKDASVSHGSNWPFPSQPKSNSGPLFLQCNAVTPSVETEPQLSNIHVK
jgi:hypothetical protein